MQKNADTMQTKKHKVEFGDRGVESSSSRGNISIVVDEQLQQSEGTSQQENPIDIIFGYPNSEI